jgi:hypothetical protein
VPPRPKPEVKTRLRATSPARYVPVPGKSRRFIDRNSGKEISYYERTKRVTGKQRAGSTALQAAQRKGFTSVKERREYLPTQTVAGKRRAMRPSTATTIRRRSALAESFGEMKLQRGENVPTVVGGRRKGLVNRQAIAGDPEFQVLEARLAQLSREGESKRRDDPFFDPGGEYAQVLEQLGRRPAGYAWRVGDSPAGTVRAMMDLRSAQPEAMTSAQQFFSAQQIEEAS